MMRDLLFDPPWWLPVMIVAAGVVVLLDGNRRQKRQMLQAGLGIALLGVLLVVVAYFVDTDVEKVVKRTRQLAESIDRRDWGTFQLLLDAKTGFAFYRNRDELVDGARRTADKIGLKQVRILSLQARQTDTLITVDVDALSEQEITMGRMVPTSWRLHWQDLGRGWFLYRIESLPNQTITPDVVSRELAR